MTGKHRRRENKNDSKTKTMAGPCSVKTAKVREAQWKRLCYHEPLLVPFFQSAFASALDELSTTSA